jgi:hypothetical protein
VEMTAPPAGWRHLADVLVDDGQHQCRPLDPGVGRVRDRGLRGGRAVTPSGSRLSSCHPL